MEESNDRTVVTDDLQALIQPDRVCSRSEVLGRDCPVPREPGIYAWFFAEIPPLVEPKGCIKLDRLTLLYIGISPKRPPKYGNKPSSQTLWDRIRYHFRGNAEGSNLRLTLGCLLSDQLRINLRRVGSGKRMTFTVPGEDKLSRWMEQNAYVTWLQNHAPWELEEKAISSLSLPLNLQGNEHHPFHPILTSIRSQAKAYARELPIVPR